MVAGATLGPLPTAGLEGAFVEPWWLDPEQADLHPSEVALAMTMLDAAARRDAKALHAASADLLAAEASVLSPLLRQQAMELHVLAGIGLLRSGEAPRRRSWSAAVAETPLSSWLRAVARSPERGCARSE